MYHATERCKTIREKGKIKEEEEAMVKLERKSDRENEMKMKTNAKILLQITYIEGRPNVLNRANSCSACAYVWG